MRTVKRLSEKINVRKKTLLEQSCLAYTREKRYWVDLFRTATFQSTLGSYRKVRDEYVKEGYVSRYGLQARQWKLALQDAMETWDKYWRSLFVDAKVKISKAFLDETDRHYAFWLLYDYPQFAACMEGKVSNPPFEISEKQKKHVVAKVERMIRKLMKGHPQVKNGHSMKLDANCYEVFEEKGRQYIKVMSLRKGERIPIHLLGKTPISGNIILLLKEDFVEIHTVREIVAGEVNEGPIVSVDYGYTEVMVDSENNHYGTKLGSILTKASDELKENTKRRNKLRDLAKKRKKAKKIYKFNLGKKKFYRKKKKVEASISQEINQAINKLAERKKPSILVTEDLKHVFRYNKPKNVNRQLSSWVRGKIQERTSFKALVKGFHHEQVNPAYGSQTCPLCDFVDKGNRKGDVFRCLHCKHEDVSDRVAAENYGRRYGDLEIRLGMLPSQVKPILLTRFHRRLEEEQSSTVPGRSAETVLERRPPSLSKETIAGRARARKHRTVPRTAKQNKNEHIKAHF